MNKIKKFLIGITVAAAAGCLCGAVACNQSDDSGNSTEVVDPNPPVYYKLDLNGRGIDVLFDGELAETDDKGEGFRFGGTVKEGVEVRFKVLVGSNAQGTPQVSLNNQIIYAGSDGFYSFTMDGDKTISVTGISLLHTVSFPKSEKLKDENGDEYVIERRIKFYDENGDEIDDEIKVVAGGNYKFKLWVSPYYKDEFTVSSGFEVLRPDGDGFYNLTEVSADSEINVSGLEMQESFANEEDGTYGDGTAEHPFELRKPVDMFYLAAIINDDYYGGRFANLHYKLMNDIDMQGEQLYVIGDNSTQYSAFTGTFDGNGYTISNFRITDEVYDQSTYEKEYLPYVGLFGYAVATVSPDNTINAPVIKNLTLKNYTVEVHPVSAGSATYVGSLLGWGIGVEITNCHAISGDDDFRGDFRIVNDNNQIVNAGGLVGRLQGAYGNTARGEVFSSAFVASSSADINMEGTGSPHSAGGLVGYLISADERAIAYVVNSYSLGSVSGAMRAGGIVGTLGRFSSVTNCYSDAEISASNRLEGLISEDFRGAYAGGIVGYSEENTIIAGCYSANYTSASVNKLSAFSLFGGKYIKTNAVSGHYVQLDPATNGLAADYAELIEINNKPAVANVSAATFTEMGWSADDWTFEDGVLPKIKTGAARTVTVKIMNGDSQVLTASVDGYKPLSIWYGQDVLDEYHISGGLRSWGYFFDKEMTKKVPYGFVPADTETTVYVGYADYKEAAGTYYFEQTPYAQNAYITLDAAGGAFIRSGGLSYKCTYSYDGSKVIVYRSCLAALSFSEAEINGGYFAYGGALRDGKLVLASYVSLLSATGSDNQYTYVSQAVTLNSVKASQNFVYGEYKDENGTTYLFRNNGTGLMTGRNTSSEFTFVPAAGQFSITFAPENGETAGRTVTVTLNGDNAADTINGLSVSKFDGFKGSWAKSANSTMIFTFDGEGYVSLNGGGKVKLTESGDAVGFRIGEVEYKATLSDGALVINGENYFLNDGFTGEWFMMSEKEQIQLTFGGIGSDGYGNAKIVYTGGAAAEHDAQYDVFSAQDGLHLRIYVNDRAYGDLQYDSGKNTASGSFYSTLYGEYRSYDFKIYDILRGVWTCDKDELDTVTFNGRSAEAGGAEVVVSEKTANGYVTWRGTYSLNDKASGTMTFHGKSYNVRYDEMNNRVELTAAGEEQPANGQLGRRDGWYGVELYDGETKYEFDGKSNVGGKGKVTVTGGDTLEYTIAADGTVTLDGTALAANGQGFSWNGKTLRFKTGFADSWLVSAVDAPLVIGEVSGYLTADVGGTEYIYSPADRTLTLTEADKVTVISLLGENEMSIACTYEDGKYEDFNCIRSVKADKFRGVVFAGADGSSWKFDGLGGCKYGEGTATYAPASGEPVEYDYKINELGYPYIKADVKITFIETADGDGEYSGGGKSYKTVKVDMYYGRTVSVLGDPNSYFFDGNKTVWVKAESEEIYTRRIYTYEIVTSVLCELIDGDGVRHNGKMAQPGATIWLTVTDQLRATLNGVTYSFGINKVRTVSGAEYAEAYTFRLVKEDKDKHINLYEFTDKDGNIFNATVEIKTEGNVLKIEPKAVLTATSGEGADLKTYVFGDGAGTVWLMGEDGAYAKAYTYKVKEINKTYELTDGEGKKYTASLTLNSDGKTYKMSLTEIENAEENGGGQA